jgi:transcriptional regulator with XRE-family HTH domain
MGELVSEITAIVKTHLVQARDALDHLIIRLDQSDPAAIDRPNAPANGRASPGQASPATLERKARKRRQKERLVAGATNGEPAASGGEWPALRQELRQTIADRGLSYRQAAAEIGCAQGTLRTWLSRSASAPGEDAQARLRLWLRTTATSSEPAGASSADASPYELTVSEQQHLAAIVALDGSARELRQRFGANRELIDKAVAGEHLAAEIVGRLRQALAGNGATAE